MPAIWEKDVFIIKRPPNIRSASVDCTLLLQVSIHAANITPVNTNAASVPKNRLPIEEFLRTQGRFKHLFTPENEHLLEEYQREVDRRWEELLHPIRVIRPH